jgi:hypothetical protein
LQREKDSGEKDTEECLDRSHSTRPSPCFTEEKRQTLAQKSDCREQQKAYRLRADSNIRVGVALT